MTCPQHPLFGERFEVLKLVSDRGPAWVTIRVPHGGRRNILRSVTDLATAPPDSKSVPLVSGFILMRVVALAEALRRSSQDEERQGDHQLSQDTAEDPDLVEPAAGNPAPAGGDNSAGFVLAPICPQRR
ncbi:DUF5372 family protein [Sphingobium sp. SA916]|uniref:DUF5372 family protein n=1 Tax=Sphingobium sp. SA916 TaxID=1851207 RepID=UPI001558C08B|nr:DUF5372 family protein [Sphingobium sp. SA916]